MPPIRAEHGLSWRKGNSTHAVASASGVVDGEERTKQPRRIGVPRRHSPSHSRTPSPNNQQVPSSSGTAIHVAAHSHVFGHGARRSPSSKANGANRSTRGAGAAFTDVVGGSSSREKRRASPDPTRKGYAHAQHAAQRSLGSKSPAFGPPPKGPSARGSASGASWGVSSPTPGIGGGGSIGRAITSPTPPAASSGRGHSSPTLCRETRGDASDGQCLPPQLQVGHAGVPSQQQGMFLPLPSTSSGVGSMTSVLSGTGSAPLAGQQAEAREMTVLDRVFLQQSHTGREDVGDDDLHVGNDEIQRHLQSTVRSQLMEATNRNASAGGGSSVGLGATAGAIGASSAGGSGGRGSAGGSVSSARSRAINHFGAGQEMELINDDRNCYTPDPVHDNSASDPISNGFVTVIPHPRRASGGGGECAQQLSAGSALAGYASPVAMSIGASNDLLDDPNNMGSAGVPPVSPSSGGGPAQGLVLDVGSSVEFLPQSGSARENRIASSGAGSRSPLGAGLTPDVQMGEASGDGQLREVVSGLDAMDLDDVDRALALLKAQKERIIAKKHAGAAAAAAAHAEAQAQAGANLVPPQPPPSQSSNGMGTANGGSSTSGSRGGGGGRQRRSSGRSRHGGEGSSPSAGGRSEAFGGSGGGVRGGAPVSFSRVPRVQGRPPPVPGHLSASTAAMRRSSPGNFASLAELDSYLEHHHRRLVEQMEGGVVADDVEAEIRASRHPRRGTRSHQRFGAANGSSNGLGSSSSSSGVPRTVGARVSTAPFFHSTLSADGDRHLQRNWKGRGGRRSGHGGSHSLTGIDDREWDPPQRGPGYKRERGEEEPCDASEDGGWGPSLRGFRGEGSVGSGGGGGGSAFLGVSGSTHTHSQTSSPQSIMSSDDVDSCGQIPVMVLPSSPNNVTFAGGRPPPFLTRIRLEAVRSPVVQHGRAPRGRGGLEDGGPVFTSPDASKHVQELCSPRSAFTPRSASSVSSLASSPARRR